MSESVPFSKSELLNLTDCAKEAALRGAERLMEWRERFAVHEKGKFDLVTDADLDSQKTIFEFLNGKFPHHQMLGEEENAGDRLPDVHAPPTWIVDPLDGTTNYVHDHPFYSVSIGLWANGRLVVGVVYDPAKKEMFAGATGLGAWLGNTRLKTSAIETLDRSLLSTGFPPDLRNHEETLRWWREFSLKAQSMRRTGSTALNLAYVAAGRFDGYWGFGNHVWDVAGGALLVEEAGGRVTNIDGSAYDPFAPDSLASNGLLHDELVRLFQHGLPAE